MNAERETERRREEMPGEPATLRELGRAATATVQVSARPSLEGLVALAPLPMAVCEGPQHRIALANTRYVSLVGGRPLLGRQMIEVLAGEPAQPLIQVLDRVFATGDPCSVDEVEAVVERDGVPDRRHLNALVQPVRDTVACITGVTVICFDVTDQVLARRQVEEKIRIADEALARAQQATRSKDEFLAMLGHELRNPLSPILTALQLMRLRGAESREQAIIERQVTHLVRLVDDLLDVSRITRGKIELRKERIELSTVVLRAIEMASPLLEQRRHRLDVEVRRRGLPLDADPARLAQVISNLLTNAAKYSEPGGRIAVVAGKGRGRIRLRVADNGIGIAPEMLGQIFDLFVQQPQSKDRAQGGLGLGLAIVRSLVELHGGRVSAHSGGPGQGSEFVVELPAAQVPDLADGSEPSGDAEVGNLLLGERILVVDDNEDAALLLADALEELGHTVRVAHDGPSALRVAAEFRPETALLDIGLPVMDGHEVARRLRSMPWAATLRLVAITGYGQESDKRASREVGFHAHMIKPIDLDELTRTLETLRHK